MTTTDTGTLEDVQQRLVGRAALDQRFIGREGERVHVLETGDGPPLVVMHGTGNSGLFLLPLLERLERVKTIAVDRPGFGQSDPRPVPRAQFKAAAVEWIDAVLDELGLSEASFLGHSMGGLWSVWFAIARPDRVTKLVILGGAPALPGARAPFPFRMMALPGVGRALQRPQASPASVLKFANFVRERDALASQPEMLDLMVASTNDATSKESVRTEVQAVIPPYAIALPSAFRKEVRVSPADLKRITAPTLIVWGEREPVGTVASARALRETIPDARLEFVPGGHAPWLDEPLRISRIVSDFLR